MPKYDVYVNEAGDGYLIDVQTDLLSDLNTRVVVPLIPKSRAPQPATRLNPTFEIQNETVVMVTQFIAAVPVGMLRNPIQKLDGEFEPITSAIDMLMQGF